MHLQACSYIFYELGHLGVLRGEGLVRLGREVDRLPHALAGERLPGPVAVCGV